MQIGNTELDRFYDEVLQPAIRACGLDPRRVDRHNQGELLKSEIIRGIEDAEIVVADITNARPNCYLEIGYTMGLRKNSHLILMCREDHFPDSKGYAPDGPRVHFDLAGYDILRWVPGEPETTCDNLIQRIKKRLALLAERRQGERNQPDAEWFESHLEVARKGMSARMASIQARFALLGERPRKDEKELLDAVREAEQVWASVRPLGRMSHDPPSPKGGGIVSEVRTGDYYDYWVLRRDGLFFQAGTLDEDRDSDHGYEDICVTSRLHSIANALVYCCKLCFQLGVSADERVRITLTHEGIEGRRLRMCTRLNGNNGRPLTIPVDGRSSEGTVQTTRDVKLYDLLRNVGGTASEFTRDLFMKFEYYRLPPEIERRLLLDYEYKGA